MEKTAGNSAGFRRLVAGDAERMAHIHMESFPGFFLTGLGMRFLQAFYDALLTSPDSLAVGCLGKDDLLVGFAVGARKAEGFYRSLVQRRGWRLLVAAMPTLLRRPPLVWRILQSLRQSGGASSKTQGSLLSVAILPGYQGRGWGRNLLNAFEAQARENGAVSITLTTDAEANDPVNRFYQNNGYSLEESFRAPGDRRMNRYTRHIVPVSPGSAPCCPSSGTP